MSPDFSPSVRNSSLKSWMATNSQASSMSLTPKRSYPRCFWLGALLFAGLNGILSCMLVLLLNSPHTWPTDRDMETALLRGSSGLFAGALVLVVMFLRLKDRRLLTRVVSFHFGLQWCIIWSAAFGGIVRVHIMDTWPVLVAVERICSADRAFTVLQIITFAWAMRLRLELLEDAFGGIPLGSHKIGLIIRGMVLLGSPHFALVLLKMCGVAFQDSHLFLASMLLQSCRSCCFAIVAWVFHTGLLKLFKAAALPKEYTKTYAGAEVQWASGIIRRLYWFTVGPCCINCFSCAFHAAHAGSLAFHQRWSSAFRSVDDEYLTFQSVEEFLCMFFDAFGMLIVVGFFMNQRPKVQLTKAPICALPETAVHADPAWQAKVDALAHRSVTVEELLDFYARLGEEGGLMPHFDPCRSTTNDVVRQAIIPITRRGDAGWAYADFLELRQHDDVVPVASWRRRPQSFVSHSWSNLFLDLVAAVVADSVNEKEYGLISEMLCRRQFEVLLEMLGADALERRYWICCFCVNQHSVICGGVPPEPEDKCSRRTWDRFRRDSVTGSVFPLCSCHEPKHWNDSPLCEVDKFDAMMAKLRKADRAFSQAIVIDRRVEIFRRIWCVAEMVEAYFSGTAQRFLLPSVDLLDVGDSDHDIYWRLSMFTVTACQATRPEDRDSILSRIPDTEAFDATIQGLVFAEHGFLNRMYSGFGTIEAAVRVLRRVSEASRTSRRRTGVWRTNLASSTLGLQGPEAV